ncbi:hypothetical protein BGZ75_003135 [Mortierella antarctica]|nr:hypothetical protein BGZ67_008826 [Mortierella alpina]KAF9985336.1 hypothetical protein BGZ75_003135 [Mortierella antarctica]
MGRRGGGVGINVTEDNWYMIIGIVAGIIVLCVICKYVRKSMRNNDSQPAVVATTAAGGTGTAGKATIISVPNPNMPAESSSSSYPVMTTNTTAQSPVLNNNYAQSPLPPLPVAATSPSATYSSYPPMASPATSYAKPAPPLPQNSYASPAPPVSQYPVMSSPPASGTPYPSMPTPASSQPYPF